MDDIRLPCRAINLYDLAFYSTNVPPPEYSREKGEYVYLSPYEEQESTPTRKPWKYKINEYGYRGSLELSSEVDNIGFFGCSVTTGIGVKESDTFVSLVGNRLGMNSINLGNQGSSIQRISKLLASSLRVIDFKSVVITLPSLTRFIVTKDLNSLHCINPMSKKTVVLKKYKALYKNFDDNDFMHYASDSIHWMVAELKNRNVNALWSSWCPDTYQLLEKIIPSENLVLGMACVDKARDNGHPGIDSHKLHADNIVDKYLKNAERRTNKSL